MTQSVIITTIICFTVIVVFLISALTRTKDEDQQRRDDAFKIVNRFTSDHLVYDPDKKEWYLNNTTQEEITTLLRLLWEIL